jgi:hypothetical protein
VAGVLAFQKKRLAVVCALANKMGRIGWAVMVRQEDFRTPQHDQAMPQPGRSLTSWSERRNGVIKPRTELEQHSTCENDDA